MTHFQTQEQKTTNEQVHCLADYIEHSGLESLSLPEEYSYASLPLCVVDAVFSIGVTYTSTRNTVIRFCDRRGWRRTSWLNEPRVKGEHTVAEFLKLVGGLAPEQMADDLFGNRQRTSTQSGILKAEAVHRFAVALKESGIDDFENLTSDRLDSAKRLVLTIPGQRSGISFDYFLMLAGDDSLIKPDRMVQRFIATAISETPQKVEPDRARFLLQGATDILVQRGYDWSPRRLDHTIWKLESLRAQNARETA